MPDLPPSGLEYLPYSADPQRSKRELAQSPNLEVLIAELMAYRDRDDVGGRSCLIAGARGAGKTTMLNYACEEAERRSGSVPPRRLIKVRLHGPSLLNPPKPVPTKDNPPPDIPVQEHALKTMIINLYQTAADPSLLNPPKPVPTEDNPTAADIPVQEHVLKTMIINLYQTAAEEICEAFRKNLEDLADWRRPAFYLSDSIKFTKSQGLELAAELRLALDEAPSAATLRVLWKRMGALPYGVLAQNLPDQGFREIVALASAADAYRSCTGQYTEARTDETSAGDKAEAKSEISINGKDLSKALVGVASGVAAGATAAALNQSMPTTALAGAITALLSMMTFSYARTRSRETLRKQEITFLPDTTVSGLVHRVLLLLRRLRQAGLAPVFVIDELDKVVNPVAPLNKLTSALKFLFADEGFFCFLTDRSYYTEISQKNREQTNTQLRTVYNLQMLVRYDTGSLREFLSKVIRPYTLGGASVTPDLEADAEALGYILVCRSRMLLFELSRDLRSFSGTDNRLNLEFQNPRDNMGHKLHLAVQLAIELVLTNEFVANRINRDPQFAQTIYDALYYPVNLWYADRRKVDYSPQGLIQGMSEMSGEPLTLDESDQDFLHTQVKTELDFLANLPELERRLGAVGSKRLNIKYKGVLLKAIPTAIPLLKRIPKPQQLLPVNPADPNIYEENVYLWNYNRSGIPYDASAIQDLQNEDALWKAIAMIQGFENSLFAALSLRPGIEELRLQIPSVSRIFASLSQLLVPIGAPYGSA